MGIEAARPIVDAPARTPLRYGLMSVVQSPETDDTTHARLGVKFEPGTCDDAETFCLDCSGTGSLSKLNTEGKTLRGSRPFTLYTRPTCSSVGWVDEAQQRAETALRLGEGRTLEEVFWTGQMVTGCADVTPHLASDVAITGDGSPNNVQPVEEQTAADVIVDGAGIVHGFALLEEALSDCYGSEGVIHVPTSVGTWLHRYGLVRVDGPRLRSPAGHLVAVGAGYPGTGPDGSLSGESMRWMYATGAVMLRRTPIEQIPVEVPSALNRTTNDIGYVAERTYIIGWDCCHLAANVCIDETNICDGGS